METKYDKYTKEQLIEFLLLDDEGAEYLRNAYDARVLENKRLKSALLDINKRIDKAIEYIGLNEEDLKLYDIFDVNGIELLKILKGEEQENSDYERTIWETEYDSATLLEKKIIDRLQILENKVNDIEDKEWSKMNEI